MQSRFFLTELIKAGHDVQTVNDADLSGSPDIRVFKYATVQNRIIITYNCDDFIQLHEMQIAANLHHAGILLVHRSGDRNKNMSYSQIVSAIANLESSGVALPDSVHSLVQYNW